MEKNSFYLIGKLTFFLFNLAQECDNCLTSVLDCKNNFYSCKFTINDGNTFYDSYLFNSYKTTVKFPSASNLACEATFIAIGNGGKSSGNISGGYGGGSGYIKNVVIDISSAEYEVTVGQSSFKGDSFVKNKKGETIIKAPKGGDANHYRDWLERCGSGYSGGGSNCIECKGGSNGLDGEGKNGGHGSGMDISEFFLDKFMLSPGDGGEPNGNFGGGGGGILVDNFGPDSSVYQGQGYGGGGGYGRYGLSGVVLLEVKPK